MSELSASFVSELGDQKLKQIRTGYTDKAKSMTAEQSDLFVKLAESDENIAAANAEKEAVISALTEVAGASEGVTFVAKPKKGKPRFQGLTKDSSTPFGVKEKLNLALHAVSKSVADGAPAGATVDSFLNEPLSC